MADWRVDNARNLRGQRLRRQKWAKPSEEWDHDHCEACMTKFAEFDGPDFQHEGYAACEEYPRGASYAWVCLRCFDELHVEMGWTAAKD